MARLLVSVRSVSEAVVALHRGVEVIDIKEPARGTLGMADLETIAAIVREVPPRVAVGVSLGEWREWCHGVRPLPKLPAGVSYLKVGLAGMEAALDSSAGRRLFLSWREALRQNVEGAPLPRWAAVLYADWQEVGAPPPEMVLELARDGSFDALLIDTALKTPPAGDGPRGSDGALFRLLGEFEVERLIREGRERGLEVAVAGSLSAAGVERAAALGADLVGVRSAACHGGRREARLDGDAVEDLVERLSAAPAALAPCL